AYPGNGVHCGKYSCTVDKQTAIGNIGNNAA
nr:RecName: Full=Bacteriocin curvaticin [Latilactobacillus curvatus]